MGWVDFFFLRREVDEMIYKHVVTSTSGENTLHGTKAQHILTLSFQFLPFFSPFIILFPLQVPNPHHTNTLPPSPMFIDSLRTNLSFERFLPWQRTLLAIIVCSWWWKSPLKHPRFPGNMRAKCVRSQKSIAENFQLKKPRVYFLSY